MAKFHIKLIMIISITMLIFSCNTDKSDIGLGILPDSDKITAYISDTTTIQGYTATVDTMIGSQVSKLIVGKYNDPIFGTTQAGCLLQFDVDASFTYRDSMIFDDAVLQLSFNTDEKIYGSKTNPIKLTAMELNQRLEYDSAYYTIENPDSFHSGIELGTVSLSQSSVETESVLQIPLNSTFLNKIKNAEAGYFDSYDTELDMKDFFYGLYLKADELTDDLLKLSIDTGSIVIKYHYPSDPSTILEANLITDGTLCSHVNLFSHDYSGTSFFANLGNQDIQTEYTYIQGIGGLKTRLKMPYLTQIEEEQDIAIFRAELIVNVADSTYSLSDLYPEIENILLIGEAEAGDYYYLPEYQYSSTSYIGVTFDSESHSYSFDITDYIQKVIRGEIINQDLSLMSISSSSNMRRTVIKPDACKLVLTYRNL